jgi:hypothetical protein
MSYFIGGSVLKTVCATFSQRFVKSAGMYGICIQNAISKDLFVFCSSPTKATLDIYTLYTCTYYCFRGGVRGRGRPFFVKKHFRLFCTCLSLFLMGYFIDTFQNAFQQIKASDEQRSLQLSTSYITIYTY